MLAKALQVSFEWIATGRGEMRLSGAAHDAPTIEDLLVVDCPHELNLLCAYRHAPAKVKAILQEIATLHSPPAARAPGPALHPRPIAVRGGLG
jgi:hypothetical protein